MKKPELLIPAGSLEVLKTAVNFGADAVYIGGEAFGLRAKAKNFSPEDMAEGIAYAHDRGVKVYVTANILAHNGDLEAASDYFMELKHLKTKDGRPVPPDALIISDPGLFMIAKRVCPEIELHISTQANSTNYETWLFWWNLGAKRVVSARELSLAELKKIRSHIPSDMEIESFVHGAMCISYSGRDYDTIDIPLLAEACEKAVETAYKAVMKPKEGTILTVAKSASLKARELADAGETDLEKYIGDIIERADYVLSQTPEMLPVLKQAGVVDSGGQGLMQVLKGAYEAFLGKEIDWTVTETAAPAGAPFAGNQETVLEESDIKFGYCTEFIIMLSKTFNIKQEMDFKAYLESIGDSIVVVADDDVVKVHVHTNDPGLAIQKALKYGALSNMKIDNMRLEHHEKVVKMAQKEQQEAAAAAPAEKKAAAFIAVSVGEGINAILKDLGVDYIIEGGQTMNPSTEDVLNAIEKVNAETVYVLPNNKNIILAANQAKYMTEDKKIVVIPTKTIAASFSSGLRSGT